MSYLDLNELYEEMESLRSDCEWWASLTTEEEAENQDDYPGLEAISRFGELEQLFDDLGEGARYEMAIPETEFEDYAQELAEDTGAIDREMSWPNYCIDWEYAARELKHDYTPFEFEGVDYLVGL
jgi:antirestriction protein